MQEFDPQDFMSNDRNHAAREAAIARWATAGGQYWGSPRTIETVPPGFYTAEVIPMQGPTLVRMNISSDDLIELPTPQSDLLLEEFELFWKRAPQVAARGFIIKRGVLMAGPPGTGKTVLVQLMAKRMIERLGGIAVMARNIGASIASLQLLRRLEPNRPVILIYEDLEAILEYGDENMMLGLLDGEYQVDKVFHVATTNYPEKLQARWINRPGRFDRVIEVGPPIAEARKVYFEAKAPSAKPDAIARWVDSSEGWSVAHMREFIVAHDLMGEKDTEVIARFNAMRDRTWFKGATDGEEEAA